jgi:hypothetical protein
MLVTLVVIAGLLLAGGAVYLTATQGDLLGPLFGDVLAMPVIGAVVVWFLMTWAARRTIVGSLPDTRRASNAALIWGGSRLALLLGVIILLVCWLGALALGFALEIALIRAVGLLAVLTAFTGIIGGAFLNSVATVRHWRVRKTD